MKLTGYCTSCRRVKPVNVSGHGLAVAAATRGAVSGECDDCREKERERKTR